MARLLVFGFALYLTHFGVLAQNGDLQHAPGATYASWTEIALGLPSASPNSSTPAPELSTTTINLA